MTAKAILDVEVNSKAFDDFAAAFGGFQADMKEAPKDWDAFGEAMAGAVAAGIGLSGLSEVIEDLSEQMGNYAGSVELAIAGQGRLSAATEKTHGVTHKLAEAAKSVAGAFVSAAKWMTIGGGLAGLATGAGLFGLDRLAGSVFTARKAATGLGVDMADQAAFRTNYASFVDPESLLSNVANARNDINQQWLFRSLGIGGDEEGKLNNTDLSARVIDQVRAMIRDVPEQMLGAFSQAHGIDQLLGIEDLRRLRREPEAEFGTARRGYEEDKRLFAISEADQLAWRAFDRKLNEAGVVIDHSLIRGLTPLTKPLGHLAEAVAGLVSAFLDGPGLQMAIESLASLLDSQKLRDDMRWWSDYFGGQKFKDDLRAFADAIGNLAQKTLDALRWLGLIPDSGSTGSRPPDPIGKTTPPPAGADTGPFWTQQYHRLVENEPTVAGDPETKRLAGVWGQEHFDYPAGKMGDLVKKYADAGGIPSGLLWMLYGAESGFGKNIGPSPAGAMGPFQFMPGTARSLGIDPMDPEQATKGAAAYLKLLYSHFQDWHKAVAAYNWGPGNVDKDIAQWGDAWEQHVPAETKKYLGKIFPNGTVYRMPGEAGDGSAPALVPGGGKDGYGDSRGITDYGGFLGMKKLFKNWLPYEIGKMLEAPPAPARAVPRHAADASPAGGDLAITLEGIRKALAMAGQTAGRVQVAISNDTAARVAVSARGVAV